VITTITVGDQPVALTYNIINNRVYVANFSSNNVSVILDSRPAIEQQRSFVTQYTTLEVYPNPARTFFTLRLPQSADREQIKIYDVTGKLVKEVKSKLHETRISLDGIKNGIYFIKVGDEIVKEKLVVTR
jgi:DNA-binding beta-propeller fold protein YncE